MEKIVIAKASNTFINELGNEISMAVQVDRLGVTVMATGPTSEVNHTWTPTEALWLLELLNEISDEMVHAKIADVLRRAGLQ